MKKIIFITAALFVTLFVGFQLSCRDPLDPIDNPQGGDSPTVTDQTTSIIFDNTQGICSVTVYNDYRRRTEDIITEVPVGGISEPIAHEPTDSVPFYFSYLVSLKGISDFSFNYVPPEVGKDQIAVRIDANTINTINIPRLDETVSSPNMPLSNSSYLLIQNNSSFSFQLFRGSSVLQPDNAIASLVNSGERGKYTVNPGSSANYRLLIGADYIMFPGSITSFEAGYVYYFVYDGSLSLVSEIELILENVAGSSGNNTAPNAPGTPIVYASDKIITISWAAVQGAENYEVYLGTTLTPPDTPVRKVPGTTTVLTELVNKTVYYIWIKAVSGDLASEFSPHARGIPWPSNEVPAAPELPVVIPGTNRLTVTWEECGGASSYEVYINTTPTRPGMAAVTIDKTSAVIGGLANNVIYYVWVCAVNNNGRSAASPMESGTPAIPTVVPLTPARPVLTAGSREITASWQAAERAESYEVWYGTQNNSAQAEKIDNDILSTETIITGLENETLYYVWIRAKNIVGTSGFSLSANARPSAFAVLPEVPQAPQVTIGSGSLSLSWTEAEGALSYEVWTGASNNSASASKHGADITDTSATLNNLTNGTTYYIWLKAKNNIGTSDFSPMTSGTPTVFAALPSNPAAPVVSAGNSQLTVNWQAAEGALLYEVWAGTDINPQLASKRGSDVSGLSAVITGLTNGTTYYVWIKAKNDIGTSGFSPTASGTPSIFSVAPGAPASPSVSIGNGQTDISWTAVGGATAYEIWTNTTNNSASAAKYGDDVTVSLSATISSLTNGTTYYIWLKAKNNAGTSGFSPAATAKPIANAAAPSLTSGNGQLTVNWAAIAGADQYEVFCGTGINPPQTATHTINAPATTATITGLTNGTAYNVWVRGKNSTGTGAMSEAASAKPIGNMGTVTVSAGNSGQLILNWSGVAGADEYEVYHSTSATMPGTSSQTVTAATATISGLTNGTTYYFWVRPKNANGVGGTSTVASGTPMASPGTLTVSAANQQITVSWTAVAGASSYQVFHSTTTIIPDIPTDTVTATNATITGLTNGATYYFWVKAVNAYGASAASPMASGVPIETPGGLTVSTANEEITVSWASVTGAVNYEVYYSESQTRPPTPADTVTQLSKTFTNLTNGTIYYFWLRPVNAGGSGEVGPMASGVPIGNMGAVTLSLGASEQLVLNWASVAGADQYEVYRNTANSMPATPLQTYTTTTATIGSLTNGTTYYFWVKPKNANGSGAVSAVVSGKSMANMGAVTVSAGGSGQLVLNWPGVAGADEYEVYHSTSTTMPGTPSQTVTAATATISGLTNGTTYYVWVRPKNANGVGGTSTGVSGVPIAAPGSLTVSAANQQITVSWTSVAGASSYQVFYSLSGTIPSTPNATANTTSITISGLTNGITYYFWVKAVNAYGTSGESPRSSGKPLGNMGTVTVNTGGSGELVLNWTAVAGADEYEVYYSTSTTMPGTASQTVSATTAIVGNLSIGTYYYLWVRPKNANGTGGTSNEVIGRPITTPSAPGSLIINLLADQQITVSWSSVLYATSYEIYYNTTTTIPSTPTVTVTTTSGTITGLTNGETYYFWVKAVNSSGTSGASARATGIPIGTLEAPVLTPGLNQITVTWAAISGANQYEVYYGTTSTPTTLATTTTNTTVTITGLTNETSYYVRLRARNATGYSGYGATNIGIPGSPGLYYGFERIGDYNLVNSLDYISSNAVNDDKYLIIIGTNETSSGTILDYNDRDIEITLRGYQFDRTISLNTDGSYLFDIRSGVTFILDINITLVGRSTNTHSLVYIQGAFVMNTGSRVRLNTAEEGGGVYVGNGGNFTMNDGTINGNSATSSGGGVYIGNNGAFTMQGGTINGNTGIGVRVAGGGDFTMQEGTISGNTGYGVRVMSNGNFTMYDGAINTNGAGVYNAGTFTMNNGTISDNTGRGVYVAGGGDFIMQDGTISGNNAVSIDAANGGGGGVYIDDGGNFVMYNGTISENTVVGNDGGSGGFFLGGYGGGVYIYFRGNFVMHNGKISRNTTSRTENEIGRGGGVFIQNNGVFTMYDGIISGNETGSYGSGGGVYIYDYGGFMMHGGTISGNKSEREAVHLSNRVSVGYFKKQPIDGSTTSGIIYGPEAEGLDADGIPLKNDCNYAVYASYPSPVLYRIYTAGETDHINGSTGLGLSANGLPPFGE